MLDSTLFIRVDDGITFVHIASQDITARDNADDFGIWALQWSHDALVQELDYRGYERRTCTHDARVG